MNQIIFKEKLIENPSFEKKHYKKQLFQSFFLLSIFLLFIAIFRIFFTFIENNRNEQIAKDIVTQLELDALYSNPSRLIVPSQSQEQNSSILGTISISKIAIEYPIFSETTDEFLKIGVCRFSGFMPPSKGNLCIAGHNYNNQKLFSRIGELGLGDEIILKDLTGKQYFYEVYDSLEVTEDDASPIAPSFPNTCELTLITCTNKNSHRIIIKAKETNK